MFALGVLILTILLGTGVVPTLAAFVGGPVEGLITPLWLLLYLGALLGLMFSQGINWISWLVRYRILLVLLILGTILSVSWSIDSRVSAERTVHLVGSTLLAVYIGFSVPLLTTLRVFAAVLALAIIGTFVAAIGIPLLGIEEYEGTQVWRGVFNSKNGLGFWAAVGVLLYVTLSDSTQTTYRKILCFVMAGLCLAALGLSHSATSLLAMIIAGALTLYLFIAGRFQLGFIRMAFLAILFTGVIAMAIANIDTAELVGRTEDLTGRGEVWRQVWKLILERPLTGVGYGSMWFPTDDTIWIQQSLTDFTWVVYHAHNGLLQVASEVGMPLALIALLMVAQQLIEIFYCQYERQQVGVLFVLAFVVAYLVSNFSEARFLVSRELFWIFFLALPISMLRQINLIADDPSMQENDEYDENEYVVAGARHAGTPYGTVPGKPWLDPLPHELAAQKHSAATTVAAAGAVALVTHQADPDASGATIFPVDYTLPETGSHADVDLNASSVSFDETDIDLGEPSAGADNRSEADVDEAKSDTGRTAEWQSNEELDRTQSLSESDALASLQDDITDLRAPIEHDRIHYSDTLDVDRYDMDLDMSGEWIDIDLDEDR
jgi:O-antigen ligase